jgi:hypothetical protein
VNLSLSLSLDRSIDRHVKGDVPVPNIPSKSHGLADENKKSFDGIEMIRNKRFSLKQ